MPATPGSTGSSLDDAYTVVAHFEDSGGIFAGGEVTYRGVRVGQVEKLELTDSGVDVYLDIDNDYDQIPTDTMAIVGNRSAVGEQYVELQPQTDGKPYLSDEAEIPVENTELPIQTDTLLTNISNTVESVDRDDLRTTVNELGQGFAGTGENLQTIIDAGDSFIRTADENFDVTTALIEDGNTVLRGQIASESALRTFASQLSLFSGTLADADPDLRRVIDSGSFAANQLRTFLEANRVDLSELIRNLVTTGNVIVKRLDGIQQLLVIYPYVVEGGFTVVSKSPERALRRPLRPDHHDQGSLPQGLRGHRQAASGRRQQRAHERGRTLRRAGDQDQRAGRPERPPAGGRHLRRGDRQAHLGRGRGVEPGR